MKFKRINLPTTLNERQEVNIYLTQNHNNNGGFHFYKDSYTTNRKTELTEAYRTDSNVQAVIKISDKDNAWEFFLYLAIGVKEAAYYLAVSFIEGFGAIKNEFLAYLCMAIGAGLRDEQTIELVGEESIPPQAQQVANKCIKVIQRNTKEVGNREITYEEAIGRAKAVDAIVASANGGQTIESQILPGTIKAYAAYVALDTNSYGYDSNNSNNAYAELSQPLIGEQANNSANSCCFCVML